MSRVRSDHGETVPTLRSVDSKLVVFTAATVLPLVLLIGIGWWGQSGVEDAQARLRALSAARSVAARIDAHFGELENLLDRLSVAVSTNANDVDANDALLRRVKSELPNSVANIFLLSLDGQTIGNAVGRHVRADDREYFRRVLAGDPLVVGDPIISRSEVGRVIPVARPVKNSRGELQAVLAVAIFPDGLREWISNQIPAGGLVRITNSNEIEVATVSDVSAPTASDLNRMGNPARQLKLKEGSEVVSLYHNVTRTVGFSKARRVPWLAAVGLPIEIRPARVAKVP
jgi:hypothetical protein